MKVHSGKPEYLKKAERRQQSLKEGKLKKEKRSRE